MSVAHELLGMMLHQDDSRHAWLGAQPALDLIGLIGGTREGG